MRVADIYVANNPNLKHHIKSIYQALIRFPKDNYVHLLQTTENPYSFTYYKNCFYKKSQKSKVHPN